MAFRVVIHALISLTIIHILTRASQANLNLREANDDATFVRRLADGDIICPDDYPSGLTIECEDTDRPQRAKFLVNGKFQRKEQSPPFYLAGDKRGVPNPWEDLPEEAKITCKVQPSKKQFSVTIKFSCNEETPALNVGPGTEPASMYFVPAHEFNTAAVLIQSGMTFCPRDSFGHNKFSIVCTSSPESTAAEFRVNGKIVREDFEAPFYISKEMTSDTNNPDSWENYPKRAFKVSCQLDDGTVQLLRKVRISCGDHAEEPKAPKRPPSIKDEKKRAGCILIAAGNTALSAGWVAVDDGVAFHPGNDKARLASAGASTLYYKFTPERTSRYAVVVDFTSSDKSRWNDFFIKLDPVGFQIMRRGKSSLLNGWLRVYHNMNGRAAFTSYLDVDAYSISTGDFLEQSVEYTFAISGRAPQVTIHQILLFPCLGTGCQRGHWRKVQNICIPGSI